MITRPALMFLAVVATALLVACGDDGDSDSNGGGSQGSSSQACDDLDAVRQDFDDLQKAVVARDLEAAQDSVDSARNDMTQLRTSISDAPTSDAAAQSGADLAGAVQGLETTLRQLGQSGSSPVGVLQQLAIQLPAIATSLNSLKSDLRCS